jgi:molecular chaperone GrpE
MNKSESSPDEDNNSDKSIDSDKVSEGVFEELSEESTVPLSQYEKSKDDYLRLAADFENYKKRTEKEKENIGAASVAYFINSLFPLIDNFEMAMSQESVAKEVETFNNLLSSVLDSLNVEEVGAVGDNFDPTFHEAVEHSGEGDTQKIEVVLRKGYLFQGNLIRPAMVKVKSE